VVWWCGRLVVVVEEWKVVRGGCDVVVVVATPPQIS
jgi:hypothetical protein